FKNFGVKHASFVLTRPTLPVSVLVEVGFMIHPYEYAQLLIPANQKQYAKAIKKGIEEYLR
ncbi:MAG: N-acetylmuramoyl-L-alanine amidase, partial [Candidatus Gastranaerophilales bacterium]|nr:N-acetylmuramoyl-L-alanine amidase [Candidatus Gastranaerophilales bacterium]